jgi:4-amino-4-deoxy-L-arabinose transferase-like glycosyltransferase
VTTAGTPGPPVVDTAADPGGRDGPAPARGPLAALLRLALDPRWQGMLLTACAALVLFARAGAGPLPNYDDAYYGEKAKQMLRTGDWLTPRFADHPRLDNPPLFLWLIAASFWVFGVSAWAAVLWSALSGVACVALTHRLATRLGRPPFEAWAAGFVLLGTGYVLKYANHAMFDVFLTALFLAALLAYRRAWEGSTAAWVAVGVLTGLGVLTKSVLGVFPLMVVALHALWCGRVRHALAHGAWLAPLAMLAVMAPWYGYQLLTHRAQFLEEHVAWLLVQRGAGTVAEPPPWRPHGYLRELALTYWPWLPFAMVGLWRTARAAFARDASPPGAWTARASARLLLLWPLVVVGVLSLAREQKLWYVMSVFPALALYSARALAVVLPSEPARARATLGGFAIALLAGAFLAFTPWGHAPVRRPDLQQVALAARSLVPPGEEIAFMGGNYWSVAHQFVFYSDRTLVRGPVDAAGIRATLEAGGWALLSTPAHAEVVAGAPGRYPGVASAGEWVLVHGRAARERTPARAR